MKNDTNTFKKQDGVIIIEENETTCNSSRNNIQTAKTPHVVEILDSEEASNETRETYAYTSEEHNSIRSIEPNKESRLSKWMSDTSQCSQESEDSTNEYFAENDESSREYCSECNSNTSDSSENSTSHSTYDDEYSLSDMMDDSYSSNDDYDFSDSSEYNSSEYYEDSMQSNAINQEDSDFIFQRAIYNTRPLQFSTNVFYSTETNDSLNTLLESNEYTNIETRSLFVFDTDVVPEASEHSSGFYQQEYERRDIENYTNTRNEDAEPDLLILRTERNETRNIETEDSDLVIVESLNRSNAYPNVTRDIFEVIIKKLFFTYRSKTFPHIPISPLLYDFLQMPLAGYLRSLQHDDLEYLKNRVSEGLSVVISHSAVVSCLVSYIAFDKIDTIDSVVLPTRNRFSATKYKDMLNVQDTTCTICFMEFKPSHKCTTLNCLHTFHFRCINKWTKTSWCCPICRSMDIAPMQ